MTSVLANASATDRSATDFYPTPPDATNALLNYLDLPRGVAVWEPAAGRGHMVAEMEKRGYRVAASDLHSYTQEDFLSLEDSRGAWIITNPPFRESERFIRHARKLAPVGGFAFLLKSQYWHAARRLSLFREITPSEILPLTWRPDFLFGRKSGSPTMDVLWAIWRYPCLGTPYIYHLTG